MHVKFGEIHWTHDSRGFFYSRFKDTETAADFAEANQVHQVWYHSLDGTTLDRLVFDLPDHPADGTGALLSDDGRWLFLTAASGTTNNRLWVTDLHPRRNRHRREAEALGTRRGRDTPTAGSRRRDRVSLHDVPGAQGPQSSRPASATATGRSGTPSWRKRRIRSPTRARGSSAIELRSRTSWTCRAACACSRWMAPPGARSPSRKSAPRRDSEAATMAGSCT